MPTAAESFDEFPSTGRETTLSGIAGNTLLPSGASTSDAVEPSGSTISETWLPSGRLIGAISHGQATEMYVRVYEATTTALWICSLGVLGAVALSALVDRWLLGRARTRTRDK